MRILPTCIHARTDARTHAHAHTRTDARTHTHTHARTWQSNSYHHYTTHRPPNTLLVSLEHIDPHISHQHQTTSRPDRCRSAPHQRLPGWGGSWAITRDINVKMPIGSTRRIRINMVDIIRMPRRMERRDQCRCQARQTSSDLSASRHADTHQALEKHPETDAQLFRRRRQEGTTDERTHENHDADGYQVAKDQKGHKQSIEVGV